MTIVIDTIRIKRATAARWAELNPIMRRGEPGYEEDTGRLKIGHSEPMHWNDLGYFSDPGTGISNAQLQAHIDSLAPHPVYDDGPSFVLLYENAKV